MIAVVVPTVRPERIPGWLEAWHSFTGCEVWIVEDNPVKTGVLGANHVSWAEIDADMGDESWIISRRSDAIRSYGFLQAWRSGAEFVVTLDDDVLPPDGVTPESIIAAHVARLQGQCEDTAWSNTIGGAGPRGMPYHNLSRRRCCTVSHGLWAGVPDYDAPTQLVAHREPRDIALIDQCIPAGRFYSMCAMNVAFRRAMTVAMYFGLQGQGWPYGRFADIWAGLLSKKICDHMGYSVWSGTPHVHHTRASNVWRSLTVEAAGLEMNESLWRTVDETLLTADTISGCYLQLADALAAKYRDDYWQRLAQAMRIWVGLFR